MHLINVIVFQKFRTQTSQDFSRHTFRKTNMGECVLGKLLLWVSQHSSIIQTLKANPQPCWAELNPVSSKYCFCLNKEVLGFLGERGAEMILVPLLWAHPELEDSITWKSWYHSLQHFSQYALCDSIFSSSFRMIKNHPLRKWQGMFHEREGRWELTFIFYSFAHNQLHYAFLKLKMI